MSEELIGSEDEEFIIEKILKKRSENGFVEYFIKWKDFSDDDNTWERADTLEGNELVVEFERQQSNKENVKNNKSGLDNNGLKDEVKVSVECEAAPVSPVVPISGAKGFDRGLKADRVVGATQKDGQLMLLIKWKDFKCADLVPASLANIKCPQVVIAFYQKNLKFKQSVPSSMFRRRPRNGGFSARRHPDHA